MASEEVLDGLFACGHLEPAHGAGALGAGADVFEEDMAQEPRPGLTDEACLFVVEQDDTGIMLVPSTLFDFDDHHVRIGFGREDLPAVLERLGRYLDETS